MLNIIPAFLTSSGCYAAGKSLVVTGLMLHSIGCPQPDGLKILENENRPDAKAAVHAVIDGNKPLTAYQGLPWDMRGWHAGGSANNHYIGIEMAEPDCIKYTSGSNFTCSDVAAARAVVTRTYNTAVQLFAELCIQYNLDPLDPGVIISHAKGHEMGIASNHGDPEHLWKQLGMDYTMDGFRADVKSAMELMQVTGTETYNSYTVRIVAPNTVGIYSFDNGYPDLRGYVEEAGTYTIVDEKSGWGKLKSGAGWILLSECERAGTSANVEEPAETEDDSTVEEPVNAENMAPAEEFSEITDISPTEDSSSIGNNVSAEESAQTENNTETEEPANTKGNIPTEESSVIENITMFDEPLNIVESVPTEEITNIENNSSVEESFDIENTTPVQEPADVKDITSVDASIDSNDGATTEEPVGDRNEIPAEETADVEDTPKEKTSGIENITMFDEPLNLEESVPTEEIADAEDIIPTEDNVNTDDNVSVERPADTGESVPAEKASDTEDNTPAEKFSDTEKKYPVERPSVQYEIVLL